ncbi:MAG: DUF2341 domain-containing protein, partial [Candidatus Hermodarchaeota archaeon]
MIISKKLSRKTKKNLFPATILLIIIIAPIITSSPLFSNFFNNVENREGLLGFNQETAEPTLKSSSSHPTSADDFRYYKNITIDHTKVSGIENLIDFPILISIFDSDLHDHVQPDGDDIAFAKEFQWLDHEIELFNKTYNSTHAQLVAWVRIPVLSPLKDTIIRMYFGNLFIESRENPTGVWNNNYEAVWHMNNDPFTSNILDSTSNNNDLNTTGFTSDTRFYDEKSGAAISVDGINDRFGISDINGPLNDFTFQTWFKFDNPFSGGSDMYFFQGNSPTNNYPLMRFSGSSGVVVNHIEVTSDSDETCTGNKDSWAANTWFQFVYSRSMSAVRAYQYINGSLDEEDNSADNANPHLPWNQLSILGSLSGTNMWGSGAISEFRMLTISLSADWISTEYNNQYDPNSFYSVSSANNVYIPSILDFQYFKEIRIDHNQVAGTSSLNNFPILISIFDSDLHDEVQPDGDDIAFNNGTEWLFHEIELFNQTYNSTHAQLITWVRIPTLSSSEDTIIRMYYGNSSMSRQENPYGVWDSDFLGVWHLKESGTGVINEYFDSTRYGNHGQGGEGNASFVPTRVVGKIGDGQDFNNLDGYYDLIDCGDDPLWDLDGYQITLQAWIQHDITPNNHV